MKKNMSKILIITIVILLEFTLSAFAIDNFQIGKDEYYKKNYAKAYTNLKIELKQNPDNVKCRYYYAQTLVKTGNLKESKKEYTRIITTSPLSKAAELSRLSLVKIEKYEETSKLIQDNFRSQSSLSGLEDNYIYNALTNGSIIRWDKNKMPIKISIEKNTSKRTSLIKTAVNEWFKYMNGKLSFIIVNDPNKSDIDIGFNNHLSNVDKNSSNGYIAGLATPQIKNNVLKKVKVRLATRKANGSPTTDLDIYNTTIHEFGHALGINGHSDKKTDIMYPISGSTNTKRKLSRRDVNTLKVLYKLDADISNTKKANKESTKNSILIGSKKKRQSKKLKEALDYVKLVPNQPLSWTKLALEYEHINKYSEAVKNYKKALEVDPKYVSARFNLANMYSQENKYYQAVKEYKTLIKDDPTNTDYSHNLAITYMNQNNKQDAINTLNSLIRKNPSVANNKKIKRLLEKLKS